MGFSSLRFNHTSGERCGKRRVVQFVHHRSSGELSFHEEPYRLEWHPVNKSQIDSIRVWVTDGRNNLLDLNGIDVALSLIIEEE